MGNNNIGVDNVGLTFSPNFVQNRVW